MNWHIGMDIVAIRDHSKKAFTEGDVFTIRGLKKNGCPKCGNYIVIDIGMSGIAEIGRAYQCTNGHGIPIIADGIWWFHETCFAPLDTLVNISELTEVLNEPAFK